MDFWQTMLVLVRRWYVVLPAFALTIALAAGVYASIPVRYVSYGVLVLTTPLTGASVPADPDAPVGVINPLLNFEQGLSTTALIMIQAMNRPEMAAKLGVHPSADTTYEVTDGSGNPESLVSGPFLFIEAESEAPHAAQQMVRRVSVQVAEELRSRQSNLSAPKRTYIMLDEVVSASISQPKKGSGARAAVAALGLGMIASLSSAFAAESIAHARRRRRERKAADAAAAYDGEAPESERPAEPVGASS